jgi:hypothetical protein
MPKFSLVIAALVLIVGLQASAYGQGRYVPPGGSTLPNALNYFRRDTGVLDQYNQFVAPQARLTNQLRNLVQQQNADYATVQQQLRTNDRIRDATAAPTGVSAGFMNYSHYYSSPAGRGSPALRRR